MLYLYLMESHSRSYKQLLQGQSDHIVVEWCGSVQEANVAPPLVASLRQSPVMHRIFFYISNEEYELNSGDFHKAEADERLEKLLLSPLHDSRLLSQVENGKCDEGATIAIVQSISFQVVTLIHMVSSIRMLIYCHTSEKGPGFTRVPS